MLNDMDFSARSKGMADGNTAVWGNTTEPSEGRSRRWRSSWNGTKGGMEGQHEGVWSANPTTNTRSVVSLEGNIFNETNIYEDNYITNLINNSYDRGLTHIDANTGKG